MKSLAQKLLTTIMAGTIVGCVTGNTIRIPSSRPAQVKNSIVVPLSKELAWAKLITGLSLSIFDVKTTDKQSGFISASYAGDPEQYVDGGELVFSVKSAQGTRESRFPASRASSQYDAMINNSLCDISRQLGFEARVNILLSQTDTSSCVVTANVRYNLTLTVTGHDATGERLTPYKELISFNTGQTGTSADSTEFLSNGKLEQSILDLVSK